MDIVREILALPNFAYVFQGNDGKLHTAILGGKSCEELKSKLGEHRFAYIDTIHRQMEKIYRNGTLKTEEKIKLAELMEKMEKECDFRLEGNYTEEEQREYISGLSEKERIQIEEQLRMYKDCRVFYREFVHH